MKKMMFGMMFFICGFFGIITFVIKSIENPWEHNGIRGFESFLIGTKTTGFYVFILVVFITGLIICVNESFQVKKSIHKFYIYLQKTDGVIMDSEPSHDENQQDMKSS